MCPFTCKLSLLLLNDADFGMHSDTTSGVIREFATKWLNTGSAEEFIVRKTGVRMALAVATTANAVLGRPAQQRSLKQTIADLRQEHEMLTLQTAEQQILRGWSDNAQTGHVQRAQKALDLALCFELFNDGMLSERADVVKTFAERAAEAFFEFAQKECASKGHGFEGVSRAVGIVVGEISIEEVVFG